MADFTPINTQEELNNIIGERLRRERETVSKEFEQKITEKDQAISKAQTDLETIRTQLEDANKKLAGIPDMEKKIHAYEVASVKRKVADETGIPYGLAERLSGETEDELRKDAEALRKMIGNQRTAPLAGAERRAQSENDKAYTELLKKLKGEE